MLETLFTQSLLLMVFLVFLYLLYANSPLFWTLPDHLSQSGVLIPTGMLWGQSLFLKLWHSHIYSDPETSPNQKNPLFQMGLMAFVLAGCSTFLFLWASAYLPLVGQIVLLMALFWACQVSLLYLFRPRPTQSHPLLLGLALMQSAATLLLLQPKIAFRILAAVLFVVCFIALPLLLNLREHTLHRVKSRYRTLFLFWILALLLLALQSFVLAQALTKTRQQVFENSQRHRQHLSFKRPVLSAPDLAGNGYDAYWAIIGRSSDRQQSTFVDLGQDAQAIQAMLRQEYGLLEPNLDLIQRHRELIEEVRLATHYEYVDYPVAYSFEMAMPNLFLVQQVVFLMNAQGIALCEQGACEMGWSWLMDSLRFLQDLYAQGLLIPSMVYYRLERLIFSFWGHQLIPERLTPGQWSKLLAQWQILLESEQQQFQKVVINELLLTQDGALQFVPLYSDQSPSETQQETIINHLNHTSQWLLNTPVVLTYIQQLQALKGDVQTYLNQAHASQALQVIQAREAKIGSWPVGGSFPPLSRVLLNYQKHLALNRAFYLHLGLQSYAQEYGCYPARLESLKRILPDIPRDPYTQQDFVYQMGSKSGAKTGAKTYRLYTQGVDQKDGGGGKSYQCFDPKQSCQGSEIVFVPAQVYPLCK